MVADDTPDPVGDGDTDSPGIWSFMTVSVVGLIAVIGLLAHVWITHKELAQSIPKEAYILMFNAMWSVVEKTPSPLDDDALRQFMARAGYNMQINGAGERVIVPVGAPSARS